MSNYVETKKELDRIRDEYGCQGEIIFRTALQYIVEHGQNTFNNDGFVNNQLVLIDVKHDKAEKEGKHLFISRKFERAFIECAQEIAKVSTYDLLVYIQKEVWLSNDGGMDYKRAIELLKSCFEWFADDTDNERIVENLNLLGFDDDEIESLGYGWLFEKEEE